MEDNYFIEENRGEAEEYFSDSKKYKLIIYSFKTKPGCWNYCQCQVFNSEGKLISTVNRNYSSFDFCFAENHPDGHDYLLCGEDYQGQTVIQLDTGKRTDWLPEEAAKGLGWCTVSYLPSPNMNSIMVEGCYWACPYEIIVKDFSNPLELPWKILKIEGTEQDARFLDDSSYKEDYVLTWENALFEESFEFGPNGESFDEIWERMKKDGTMKAKNDSLAPVCEYMLKGYVIVKTYKTDLNGKVYLFEEKRLSGKEWNDIKIKRYGD